jgi:hypothetical protein
MMPLSEIFFLGIVFYLLYKFIFNFFLPILKTTRHVRQQFRNMHETMNGDQAQTDPYQASGNGARGSAQATTPNGGQPKKSDPSRSSNTMGEYIDFEEFTSLYPLYSCRAEDIVPSNPPQSPPLHLSAHRPRTGSRKAPACFPL